MKDLKLSKLPVVLCLAAAVVLGGCHKKAAAPPPPPPPPPPPAPTATISVSPTSINAGQSATVTWSTTNANAISISGIGTVSASGSKSVSPTQSGDYTITATGAGGTAHDTARLTVNVPPPPPAPAPSVSEDQLFQQNVKDVYFDYDKYDLRSQDSEVAQDDASFLKQHPDIKVLIAGHCDERGSEEYNIALGQNRAQALQHALVNDGISASRIRVISYGKEKPFCTESNEACWQQNRRDHITIDK